MNLMESTTEYTNWLLNEGKKLGKEDIEFLYIQSLNKYFCVCGTPLAIEPMLEKIGYMFFKEWDYILNEKDDKDLKELRFYEDEDTISEIRDTLYQILEKKLNMEITFISTEY